MKWLPVVLGLCLLVISGCGGSNSSSTTTTAITITPTSATLTPGQTTQFTATVTNNTNTAVTWQVDGVTGGGGTTGIISTTGLYTAPSSVSSQLGITITAVSQADTTKTASALITLNTSNVAPKPPILLSPPSAVLSAGAQQTFTASVNGAPANVTWSISCQSSVAANCGAITQAGVYTAPFFPPPLGAVTVTAVSADASALTGNAGLSIQISNQSLFGQYAFSLAGRTAGNLTAYAGSVTFDGQGNVTGGIEDIGGGASALAITGGSYHVGADGRGNATITTSSGSTKWQMVLTSHSHILLTAFDAAGPVGIGTLDSQSASVFSAASFQGRYSFLLNGASNAKLSGTLTAAGAFTADGVGAITLGFLDVNDTGTVNSSIAATGTFTGPSAQGRGALNLATSIGAQTFVYYMVDASHLKLLQTGASSIGVADLTKQDAGPYTATSLAGAYVTVVGGAGVNGPASTGGIITLNAAGTLTATLDMNNNGNVSTGQALTGTFTVTDSVTGRTAVTLNESDGAHQFVLYPTALGALSLLELDAVSAGGPALPQPIAGFANSSFLGTFATQASGTDFTGTSGPEAFTGLFMPNGGSAITGVMEINDNGTLAPGTTVSGSYAFDGTGRATVNLTGSSAGLSTAHLTFYAADGNRALLMGVDSSRVLTGILQKQ